MKASGKLYGLLVLLLVSLLLVGVGRVYSQDREFTALGGLIVNDSQKTGAWQLDYSQAIKEPFRFSVSYLNEGHFTGHHRDGLVAQAWAETRFSRFTLGAGIGPYLIFFDTKVDDSISRGIGGVMSLDGKYFVTEDWFLTMRYNYIVAPRMNTHMFFGGAGYAFDRNKKPIAEKKWQPETKNEITLYLGDSIMNNHSGSGFASAVEYRRNLSKHFDATLAYINESRERQGGAAQLWAVQRFFDECLSLGIGGGAYEAVEKHLHSGLTTNGIITGGLGYRLYGNWEARASFSRVVAPHSRDSDLVMGGLGLKF